MAQKNTLVADIESFITKSEDRLLAVMRGSLRDMVEDMQVPTAKGGRMRVKTGFLRASGRASNSGWPTGNGVRPAGATEGQFSWDGKALNAVLLEMKLGDTFHWGWVANYAQVRELHDGFMVAPLQNWQGYVTANSEKWRGK